MCVLCLSLVFSALSGCSGKGNEAANAEYEYSDYVFNNDEAQYYMSEKAAAAETGYYYTANSPVYTSSYKFLYYFDMVNKNSMPLCTKLNCAHNDENCDAYLSDDECLSANIWYYNQRIYMIEKTAEKDILVSYDKTGRDKKQENILSVDGMSVRAGHNSACVIKGRIFYILKSERTQYIYEVSLDTQETPKLIKQYTSENKISDTIMLLGAGDYLYISIEKTFKDGTNDYIIESYNVEEDRLISEFSYASDGMAVRGSIYTWDLNAFYDENRSFYFISVSDDAYCINRLNLDTKENTEIYAVNLSDDEGSRESYIKLQGIDDKYLYLYEQVDITVEEKAFDYEQKNYLYIINKDGLLVDTVSFKLNEQYMEENDLPGVSVGISAKFIGGDARYLLLGFYDYAVDGFELTDEYAEMYNELYKKVSVTHEMPEAFVVGALDKKQIGSGEIELINITP